MTHPAGGGSGIPPAESPPLAVWRLVSTVVAPATLLGAVLFYFGYVSARAQFAYFGVDVDTLGFSTQEFVMRSPQPLLVPVLAMLLAAAATTWAAAETNRRLGAADPATVDRAARSATRVALGLIALGLALLAAYPLLGGRELYPLVTPLLIGLGGGLLALRLHHVPDPRTTRTTVVILTLLTVAALFWGTATLAEWSGRGRAKEVARDLQELPAVVIDTAEPLFAGDDTVVESVFPESEGQAYRYRYRGLRVLAEGEGRLFLVPERWSPSGSTYVVSMDAARVRFRFVDDPP